MELWFIAAVVGAVLAGLSNFCFKIAAVRKYNAELFSLYGAVTSLLFVLSLMFVTGGWYFQWNSFFLFVFIGGCLASVAGILKVYALRYIDSTIYFPLFKLLAPALAIVAGILIFNESFSFIEWVGMGLGLTVPLMLITKAENGRQHNLAIGLGIVLVTGFISAGVAVVNKIAIDAAVPIFGTVLYTSLGILCTTVFIIVLKNGVRSVLMHIKNDTTPLLVFYSSLRASLISLSLFAMLYAYTQGGTLAVVQTVHSMYILIPIVLAIVFYNEHWNIQKVIAIILSVAALAFLQ